MSVRTEKPFQKIPSYHPNEILIKPNVNSQLENSKRKKLTITKLVYDAQKLINNTVKIQ